MIPRQFTEHKIHINSLTHRWLGNLTIIGSDNGLSPGRRQAIIWTNAGILLIGPLGTNLSEILIKIYACLFKKMHWKMPYGKWQSFCLSLNVLTPPEHDDIKIRNFPVPDHIDTTTESFINILHTINLNFHITSNEHCFCMVFVSSQITYGLSSGFAPNRWQATVWTNTNVDA